MKSPAIDKVSLRIEEAAFLFAGPNGAG